MAIDPTITERADTAVKEAERVYTKAWLESFFLSDEAQYQLEHVVRPGLDTWQGDARRWAEEGKRANGTSYSWEQWFEWGKELTRSASEIAQCGWDASAFAVVAGTVTDTATDVGNVASKAAPWNWPTWLPVVLVLGVVAYALNAAASWRRR